MQLDDIEIFIAIDESKSLSQAAERLYMSRFDTHETMISGVKAGLGWGIIPECIAARYRHDPDLLWMKVDTDPMRYPVQIHLSNGFILRAKGCRVRWDMTPPAQLMPLLPTRACRWCWRRAA